MSAKEAILERVQRMPDDSTRDEIVGELSVPPQVEDTEDSDAPADDEDYRNFVRQMIEIGLRQIENGEGIPHEEVKHRFAQKFKGAVVPWIVEEPDAIGELP